jgi:hypothetical protein
LCDVGVSLDGYGPAGYPEIRAGVYMQNYSIIS